MEYKIAQKFIKRFFDFLLAPLLLVCSFPFIILCMVIIKINSPEGPVIFKQVRSGYKSKSFTIYKLRTMTNERSSNGDLGPSYKSYLDYLETDLGQTLVSKLEAAEISLNDLDSNFINQINTNNTKMLLAFDALQTIVVNLKTDMLSNFNIAVDYVDADGD